ncbi:hypothetical protein D018_0662A, partial [Vibrio parahaemolyticus VP2007-007]
MPARFSLLPKA